MNKKLIEEIESEIRICDKEIRKADDAILKATEHRTCYDDRKIMLSVLLDRAKSEEKERDPK